MSRSWWPFWRRSDTSKNGKTPGKKGSDRRFNETRRIVRHLRSEALRDKQEPEEEPPPPPPPARDEGPTVTGYGDIVHVNYHATWLIRPTIVRKDPVTKTTKRVARRFDRSEVFYAEDGRLIGDDDM